MSASSLNTIELLEEVIDFLEPYLDVRDGCDGSILPNAAMVLSIKVDEEILRLKRSACSATPHAAHKED